MRAMRGVGLGAMRQGRVERWLRGAVLAGLAAAGVAGGARAEASSGNGAQAPAPAATEAAAAAPVLALFEGREVTLALPTGWTGREERDPQSGTVSYAVADPAHSIDLLLTFLPDPEGRWAARPGLETQLRVNLEGFLEGAVEKEVRPTFFTAADGEGVYTTLTDKRYAPGATPAGERRYATSGLRSWKGVGMPFTLLSNTLDSATDRMALEMVRSGVRQTRGPAPAMATPGSPTPPNPAGAPLALGADPQGPPQFTLPTAPWALVLPEKIGLKLHLQKQEVRPDGSSAYFILSDEKLGFVVSFWIEPLGECRTSRTCRDFVWKGLLPKLTPLQPEGISLTEVGEVSIAEYLLPSHEGKPVRQQNWIAELVQDDFWVDLHLSKTDYKPTDRGLFVAFLRGLRFEPKQPTPPPGLVP